MSKGKPHDRMGDLRSGKNPAIIRKNSNQIYSTRPAPDKHTEGGRKK
jgi:hypothetical protein